MLWIKRWFSAIIFGGFWWSYTYQNLCTASSWWYNEDAENRMSKFDLEKKLQHFEIGDFGELCAFYLSDWLTQWLPTGFDGKVPPNFGPLRIVRFWKVRAFEKLTSWTIWGDQNLGPHPTGIKFIIYIWIESDFSSIKGKNLRNWKLWWGFATPKY